jgi:hypothetical protein
MVLCKRFCSTRERGRATAMVASSEAVGCACSAYNASAPFPVRAPRSGVAEPTRDSQTSRNPRKLLKTNDRAPLYPRQFSSLDTWPPIRLSADIAVASQPRSLVLPFRNRESRVTSDDCSNRYAPTIRNARNLLKTKDRAPFYSVQISSRENSPSRRLFANFSAAKGSARPLLPFTNHQSPVTSHELRVTNHEPRITSRGRSHRHHSPLTTYHSLAC